VFKSVFISVFVLCVLLQSGFVALHTIARIRQHKSHIKSILKKELKSGKCDAVLVAFTEDQLREAEWEHSKEFFLGDDKFDVVRTSDSAGVKIYHCINDKKEKEFFKALDKGTKQNTLLEDVLKKFCVNTFVIPGLGLQPSGRSITHSDHFSMDYTYGFTHSLFRPPSQNA
jgi:hypothetical protein